MGTQIQEEEMERWAQIRFLIASTLNILVFIVMWGQYAGMEARLRGKVYQASDATVEMNRTLYSDILKLNQNTQKMLFAEYAAYDAYLKETDKRYPAWRAKYNLRVSSSSNEQ